MLQYSPDTFRKIKAVCEVIQERVELDNSFDIKIRDFQPRVLKGVEYSDAKKVLKLLAEKEKVIRFLGEEPVDKEFAEISGSFFKILVLPKFRTFIKNDLGILLTTVREIGEIKSVDYLINSATILLSPGQRYYQITEGRDPIKSKSAAVLEHLWNFRRIIKKSRVTDPGDSVLEENLVRHANCKSTDSLKKIVQRLNKFLSKNCIPIKITNDSNNDKYQLIVDLP